MKNIKSKAIAIEQSKLSKVKDEIKKRFKRWKTPQNLYLASIIFYVLALLYNYTRNVKPIAEYTTNESAGMMSKIIAIFLITAVYHLEKRRINPDKVMSPVTGFFFISNIVFGSLLFLSII